MGGGRTVRGIGREMSQSSTLAMIQTAMRLPSGNFQAGRSTMAEYGSRSLKICICSLGC